VRPIDFEMNGLCRLAIRDGQFVVLFPELKNPEQ